MKMRIGILISGGGTNMQSLIDNIESGKINAEISVVVSNRKKAYGLQRAENHGIKAVFVSRKEAGSDVAYDEKLMNLFADEKVDLVVLAGYIRILTPKFIGAYRNKIINIHPSLIPSFCGKGFYGEKVHQAVIDYGAKVTGCTVHFVDEDTDTGAIILQKSVLVSSDDTAESLQKKVLTFEHKILAEAVAMFCNKKLQLLKSNSGRSVVKII